ncbi:hypothetical protein TW81_09660 [Vibrio galatheae]|uniref:acyl-homoserine-lactone synthase n=1 Tax=Vibrio galatheae TaxID=579748 RepID=A0A0F4NMF2_9VIBR|nr:acyl-homoserine-lactone synthase [Vibrio galatheae]KJY83266.1 hypothetical protein TW81_09660 [Vibrio galatheae]
MTLFSKLTACLAQDVLTDAERNKLFLSLTDPNSVYHYRDLFHSLVNKRRQMAIGLRPELAQSNLRTIYNTPEYKSLVQRGGTATSCAPKRLNEVLEQVALKHFDSISRMWAYIELDTIIQRRSSAANFTPGMTFIDDEYQGLLVEDIKCSSLQVYSPHKEGLFSLRDAVCLANIDLFVLEQGWYELLPLLDLSAQGCHFILLHNPNEAKYPCLASSAMITCGSRYKQWLSHSEFFQHNNWHCLFNELTVKKLTNTGAFTSLSAQAKTLQSFDNQCISSINDETSLCEILRLTTAGQKMQRLYLLYLAQKAMANCLKQAGYRCAYTIIDNPWLLNFYAQLGSDAYIDTGCYAIEPGSNPTYRGMWLIEEFNFQYSSIDFRQYKQMVRNKVCNNEVNDA